MISSSNVMKGSSDYTIPEFYFAESIKPVIHDKKQPETPGQSIADAVLDKARSDALEIIKSAEKKAEAIINEANRKSEEIYTESKQTGQREGYAEGLERGMTEADEKIQCSVNEVLSVAKVLGGQTDEFINSSQDLILNLAVEIAKKVVGENFAAGAEAFYTMFERVIKQIPPAKKLILTVSEKDYRIMAYDPERISRLAEGFANIELRRDEGAMSGTLRIESPVIELDASLSTQIEILKAELWSEAI